jgi:hypothetical protein
MSKEFKDSRNVWATLSLFGDRAGPYKERVRFATFDEARVSFIDQEDPTGFLFSEKYLGGYAHWKALKASSLGPEIEAWEEELEVKMKCEALQVIKGMAAKQFQAAKLLLDRGWEKKAGRPTKASVDKETRVQSKLKLAYDKDASRITR